MTHTTPSINFGQTAADYIRYRAGFPDAIFDRLASYQVGVSGQRILDVGTGTGTLARGFALRGCAVTALDPADEMMQAARHLDAEAGVSIQYVRAPAEHTGLASGTFDSVTAGQCWHWFDRPRAAAELKRVLRPDGKLVIAHFDWLELPGNVVEATVALTQQHNPTWNPRKMERFGRHGVYPQWLYDVQAAGFTHVKTFSFDVAVPYTHEAWRGRVRASAGVAASLSLERVAAFDAALAAYLKQHAPNDPVDIPHRVWALVCRKSRG